MIPSSQRCGETSGVEGSLQGNTALPQGCGKPLGPEDHLRGDSGYGNIGSGESLQDHDPPVQGVHGVPLQVGTALLDCMGELTLLSLYLHV